MQKTTKNKGEFFFGLIRDAATTCGDRTALSFLELEILQNIAVAEEGIDLAHQLIRGRWMHDQLSDCARAKIKHLTV